MLLRSTWITCHLLDVIDALEGPAMEGVSPFPFLSTTSQARLDTAFKAADDDRRMRFSGIALSQLALKFSRRLAEHRSNSTFLLPVFHRLPSNGKSKGVAS